MQCCGRTVDCNFKTYQPKSIIMIQCQVKVLPELLPLGRARRAELISISEALSQVRSAIHIGPVNCVECLPD